MLKHCFLDSSWKCLSLVAEAVFTIEFVKYLVWKEKRSRLKRSQLKYNRTYCDENVCTKKDDSENIVAYECI